MKVSCPKTKRLQKELNACWTVQVMSSIFEVSTTTIHDWRRDLNLPAVVIPGESRPALRFVPSEVKVWAKAYNKSMRCQTQ